MIAHTTRKHDFPGENKKMFTGGLGRLELIDGHIRHYIKYKPSKNLKNNKI
jgi:hypothetical protein